MSKKILGLDLGTNSIGWALVEIDHDNGIVRIIGLGTRILPMDAGEVKKYKEGGKTDSTAAQRTNKRGTRRLNERFLLRRDRLHLVLNLLEALPEHYRVKIDFINVKGEKCGQFKKNSEPKLAYLPKQKGQKAEFLFKDSYQEMLNELGIENKKHSRIPYDWTLYYLRNKALSQQISLEEFAWVLLSYNQKRGYEKTEVEDKSAKENEIIDELDLQVTQVLSRKDKDGKAYYEIHLDGNDTLSYKEYSDFKLTQVGDLKKVIKTSKVDDSGNIVNKKTEFAVVDIYNLEIKDIEYEQDGSKHKYTLKFNNGWHETKQTNKYTYRYNNVKGKSYDYIVETNYTLDGNIKKAQGKDRKLREPDYSDNSSDWTLLKKKTEKEALAYNNKKFGHPYKYISTKIFDVLKTDAMQGSRTKIIGGIFQVVDRDFYREELKQIIKTQKEFHKRLSDNKLFEQCVKTLYPKNNAHAKTLLTNKDAIQHLLVEDILLYQRPLKRKNSEIANCKYEVRYWDDFVNKETGEVIKKHVPIYRKVVSTSHPLFQEFRIWDKIHSIKLIQPEYINKETGEIKTNVDVTELYFTQEAYQELFHLFNTQKTVTQKQFLSFCKKQFKLDKNADYVWNFPEDEDLKGNATRLSFITRFKRCGFKDYDSFLTKEKEMQLWHYLYSINYKERIENNNKSITSFFNNTFFKNFDIDIEVKEKIIKDFVVYPKFPSKYCAYSEKALKKLIPLIRISNNNEDDCWQTEQWYIKWQKILENRKQVILDKLATIEFEDKEFDFKKIIEVEVGKDQLPYPRGLFNVFKGFSKTEEFRHLNLTKASYLAYGRHSELAQAKYWTSPKQIREELHQELKQHSLNNPVAEKVLLEMMQVVADIWDYYGNGKKELFSEIHVEVARELKKSAKEKDAETKRQNGNKAQNKRLRQVLNEFFNQAPFNANPNNKDHFERLKILEDTALNHYQYKNKEEKKAIDKILNTKITKETFEKYKLWVEQGYISPYTGEPISLTNLFDGDKYNVDHVFPQASVTNNSLSNKVVCETEVNKLKSNQTGREFVNNPKKRKIHCLAQNKEVCVVDDKTYVENVCKHFSGNKRHILLAREIPKGFTNSQMNNTRHIARKAIELLSHIVREQGEVEFCSKHVLPITGSITSVLKKAWRLNEVWTELVSPRFIRMNELTRSNLFGQWQTSKNGNRYFDCNIDDRIREKNESYDIKRIDHRHHALDALIVALCTKEHVQYLNNINADTKQTNFGKQKQLEAYRLSLKQSIMYSVPKKENPKEKNWYFMRPGEVRQKYAENTREETVLTKNYYYKETNFKGDWKKMTLAILQNAVTSFKTSKLPIRKTSNKYWSYKKENGELNLKQGKVQKNFIKQIDKNNNVITNKNKRNIAIRQKMHDEIPYGEKMYKFEILDLAPNFKNRDKLIDEELKVKLEDLFYNNNEDEKLTIKEIKNDIHLPKKAYFSVDEPVRKYTTRKSLVGLTEKQIYQIADPFIFKNIRKHIAKYNSLDDALSSLGVDDFNKSRQIPIKKVSLIEDGDKRYILGKNGIKPKQKKMVEGTNYCFIIDKNEEDYSTLSLKELIDDNNVSKYKSSNNNKFFLSAGDLVYLPDESNKDNFINEDEPFKNNRVYRFVNSSGYTANFVPVNIASVIWDYGFPDKEKEFNKILLNDFNFVVETSKPLKNEIGLGSKQNKSTRQIIYAEDTVMKSDYFNSIQLKEKCVKLKVDRLGNVSNAVE